MKGKIAQRVYTDKIEQSLLDAMTDFKKLTGREYGMISQYKMNDAEYAIVGMGSMIETAESAVDYLRLEKNIKVGIVHVTSFRPFPGKQIVEALKNVNAFSVLERMDNPLAESNPLTMEIKSSFADNLQPDESGKIRVPKIYSGSAGLGSRDVRPDDIIAVVENMIKDDKKYFAIGIQHDLAINAGESTDIRCDGTFSMRGHSVGGYGSVTTNKIIATIVADLFDMYVQAYPKYGSEKKGLPTTYYLTVSPKRVKTHNELEFVEFVPLNDVNAFNLANPLKGLQEGGMLFVQSPKTESSEIWCDFPKWAQKTIKKNKIKVLALDTVKIAKDVSSRPDLIQRMQGIVLLGIFLKATPFLERSDISEDDLMDGVEKSLRKYFGKRGEQVVQDNLNAVKRGFNEVFEVKQKDSKEVVA
jgi:pyruvate-ferredoxin/flavodoxin oxidoreductase